MVAYFATHVPTPEGCVMVNKNNLDSFAGEFQKAVGMFQLVKVREWGQLGFNLVAARDAALQLYHYHCCLKALKKQIPRSPLHAGKVDTKMVREAKRRFNANFPSVDQVRHAVAHAAEIYESPESMQRHRLERDSFTRRNPLVPRQVFLVSEIENDVYRVGINGEVASIHLNHESVDKLKTVTEMVNTAFSSFAAHISPSI